MAENDDAQKAPAKKSNLKMIIIVVVAVLIAVALSVGATMFFLKGRYGAPAGETAKAAATQKNDHGKDAAKGEKPEYTEVKDPFIVTLNEQGATHYFQVFVAFMALRKDAISGLESRMPDVRNQLRLLFAEQDFMKLQTTEGKKALQKKALQSVNTLLKQDKLPPINQVLFTNFVLQ